MVHEVELIKELTDKQVKVLVEDEKRRLQDLDSSTLEEKPFIELEILPGANSDPELLKFNYTAWMTDT